MSKRIVVIIDSGDPERVREALRGAVGLSLRGDRVHVLEPAGPPPDPVADRSRAMLRELGHRLSPGGDVAAAIAEADAVEVWT